MIRNLHLKDFAVVSEAELAFGQGMTAISAMPSCQLAIVRLMPSIVIEPFGTM